MVLSFTNKISIKKFSLVKDLSKSSSIQECSYSTVTTYKISVFSRSKILVYNFKPNIYTISIRSMHRITGNGVYCQYLKQQVPSLKPLPPIRGYPGEFRARKWVTNLDSNQERRLGLTQHETTHSLIEEVKTGRITMLASSSKGLKAPNGPFQKISYDKMDGTCIPKVHEVTNQPLMDDFGYFIPDPNKGGQRIAIFVTPRKINKDVDHLCPGQPEYQEYLDKHESTLKGLSPKHKDKLTKNLGGQDDE